MEVSCLSYIVCIKNSVFDETTWLDRDSEIIKKYGEVENLFISNFNTFLL